MLPGCHTAEGRRPDTDSGHGVWRVHRRTKDSTVRDDELVRLLAEADPRPGRRMPSS